MKYSRFESLVLSVGSLSIVWTVLSTWRRGQMVEELVAQGLLLIVLVAAVHWGRRAGTLAAFGAMAAYAIMRAPWLMREGFSGDLVAMVAVRTLTYAVVGIGGGALCGQIRYLLARLDSNSNLDQVTGLLNQKFVFDTLQSMVAQHQRYHAPFSIGLVTLPAGPEHPRRTIHRVGAAVRKSLRLVDDVARLDDGRFLLLLPHTEKPGAQIAAGRVRDRVQHLLGLNGPTVEVEVLSIVEDLAAICSLCGAVAHDEADRGTERTAA